ncbi:hypothetical protein TrLO_g12741 [Triparma laevis f. longispina]|uniref:Mitochondrial fission process protein 1 n=1 Tax=Triparma laevis f. longispina TaxID=1714387 RepID=A0A9W6ZI84_9STRA|nr:hypothetical protein TrLO_g12741 [Triparma laevis f. longispina]
MPFNSDAPSSQRPTEDRLTYLLRLTSSPYTPPSSPPKSSSKSSLSPVNIWRLPPLRYLGYINELGETLKPHLSTSTSFIYPLSYLMATGYVVTDSYVHAGMEKEKGKGWGISFADGFTWQIFASVLIPGFVINRTVAGVTAVALNRGMALKKSQNLGSIVGLGVIPVIVKPIDEFVEWGMDVSVRRFYK